MLKLLKNPEQIITVNTNGKNFKFGKLQNQIGLLSEHSIIIENNLIADIIPNASIKNESTFQIIDLTKKIILPGLVESHTHTVFAGSRSIEFMKKLKGVTYDEIAKSGGGINTTVTAVREKSFEELVNLTIPKIKNFISQGVTTLEIKSGYGLNFENEIKMLNVINHLNKIFPIEIVSTFLGAHTFPNDLKNKREVYLDEIILKMLPFISENKLAEFCDGFCETSAFTPEEIEKVFIRAKSLGLKLKLHSEQFNNIGGLEKALEHNAISIDHLEVLKENQIEKLKNSDTVSVLLPGVSYFLNYDYAPARKLIDNDCTVALATDYNPGSSNINSLSLIFSLAAIKLKMTPEEIISAYTINAAKSLDRNLQVGSIELGKKADFSIFDTTDYSELIYNVNSNLNIMTIKNGEIIYHNKERE